MEEAFGVYELVEATGVDETMTREQILDRLFDYYRNIYDGQVTDNEVYSIAETALDEVCDYVYQTEYIRLVNTCERFTGMREGDMWFEYTTFLRDELGIEDSLLVACVVTGVSKYADNTIDYEYTQYILRADGCAYAYDGNEELNYDGLSIESFGMNVSEYSDWGVCSRDMGLLRSIVDREFDKEETAEVLENIDVWMDKFRNGGGQCIVEVKKIED